ncbi:MAG: hypothetical protein LBU19_06065 [Treponema sp.]|jgi:hypothetical protein|nr:hypothetical protein [Treponema sp.]
MAEIRIREVAFRRKFNLGNYETFDVELVATVSENQDAKEVVRALDKATQEYKKERVNG